jgi:hypothetical protein
MPVNTRKISNYAIAGGIASLLFLLVSEEDPVLLPLWLLFMLLGNLFYRGRTERNLFKISFNVSLFLLPLFIGSYVLLTGKPFFPGGDSETYYDNFSRAVDTGDLGIGQRARYILYYIVSWKYLSLLKAITGSTSYLYIVFLTMFISANVAPLLYKIGRGENFKEKILLNACLLSCVFPLLVETSTAILREGFTTAPFLLFVYLSQKIKNATGGGKIKYLVFLSLVFLWIANIRFEVSMIAVLFYVLYNHVFTGEFRVKNYIYLGVIALLAAILVLPNVAALQTGYFDLNRREEFEGLEKYGADSLSASLRQQGFFARFFLFFYCAILPIPPTVFFHPGIPHYYLMAAGNVLWYFALPASVIEIFRIIKRKECPAFSKSFLITTVAAIFMVTITYLGSARLKIFIYPIMFLFFFSYLASHSRQQKRRLFFVLFFAYAFAAIVYMSVK